MQSREPSAFSFRSNTSRRDGTSATGDAVGDRPAPADPGVYAIDPDLRCRSCDRRYRYVAGTETLVEHPATMTHAGLDPDEKKKLRVNSALVRLSIGFENPDDLIHDISTALDAV